MRRRWVGVRRGRHNLSVAMVTGHPPAGGAESSPQGSVTPLWGDSDSLHLMQVYNHLDLSTLL